MRTISTSKLTTPTATITASSSSPITVTTRSPWHSPVPYLFGGLAAMLGLIAFALLMLACSYWRLSGQLQNQEGNQGDLEKEGEPEKKEPIKAYEENILVIMAGDEKPTFLATPVCRVGGSDFHNNIGNREDLDVAEKEMDKDNHVVVQAITTTQENEGSLETQQEQQSQ